MMSVRKSPVHLAVRRIMKSSMRAQSGNKCSFLALFVAPDLFYLVFFFFSSVTFLFLSSFRNKELEEIKSYMRNLETQMWSLNEKYGVLSASYGVLKDKFESYQNHQTGTTPNLSSLGRSDSIPRLRNIPTFLSPMENNNGIVRMISIDCHSQSLRTVSKDFSPTSKETKYCGVDEQERKKRKQITDNSGLGSGLGALQAMAAAASLHSHSENTQCIVGGGEEGSLRSSLADLLNAANFNNETNHSSTQIKTE